MRITGDPEAANNGLFYIHSDHLGSTSVLTKYSDGYIVGSSLTRYTPFGGYRTGGPNQITDRAYTGQRENMALGLCYYNARYYLPGVGRFLSADTLVPDKENPQALNRYSYTANYPLKFVDVSGHCWGFASGLRNTFYQTTCENLDMAVSIIQHPDASVGEKALAVTYIGTKAVAHDTVVVGTGVAAVGCLTGAGTAVCAGAGSAVTAASANGDPTNEAAAVANSVSNAVQAVSADGNPTNEAIRLYRAVSKAEFQQLMETGEFQSVAQSAEGKYFATTIENAGIWGEKMMGTGNFRIIQVDVSTKAASEFIHWNNLDGIGPAYYATLEQLENAYWNITGTIQ